MSSKEIATAIKKKAKEELWVLRPRTAMQFKNMVKTFRMMSYMLLEVSYEGMWLSYGNHVVKVRFPFSMN